MRKVFPALLFLCFSTSLAAQTSRINTMIGIPFWYGIGDNYQSCERFQTCPEEYLDRNYFWLDYYAGRGDSTELFVTKAFTDHRLAVRGVAVMTLTNMGDVNPNRNPVYFYDGLRTEEEVMILNVDTLPIVSATWYEKNEGVDVAVPQCTQTMTNGDDAKFLHFALTEVFFDHSVAVDTSFFIGGTMRNNATTIDLYGSERFLHKPTLYPYVAERYSNPCTTCVYTPGHFVGANALGGEWQHLDAWKMWSGPFFLILDTNHYHVMALSNNDTMGSVSGSGKYEPLDRVLIGATPFDGYRFVRWHDGATENPREVEVLGDTTLVAVFRDVNDTMALEKVSFPGPVFSLNPNPTHNELWVTTSEDGCLQLQLYDASGRMLKQQTFFSQVRLDVGNLTAGQFFVVVTSNKGARVEAFVKR